MGAKYKNKLLGTLGEIGVVITILVRQLPVVKGDDFTNDKKLDKYARDYHDHGHELNPNFQG